MEIDVAMRDRNTARWILAVYLLVYTVAITISLLVVHSFALAAVHVALLTSGALALRTIFPNPRKGRF